MSATGPTAAGAPAGTAAVEARRSHSPSTHLGGPPGAAKSPIAAREGFGGEKHPKRRACSRAQSGVYTE